MWQLPAHGREGLCPLGTDKTLPIGHGPDPGALPLLYQLACSQHTSRLPPFLGITPAPRWHPAFPRHELHCQRVCSSPALSNPSRAGQHPGPSSAQPVPSPQVIKQRPGQDKLPAGLRARCKSNGRKRESEGSWSQRVRKRPAAPFRRPAGNCPAWGRARKSRPHRDPRRDGSHSAAPACSNGALCSSSASLSPALSRDTLLVPRHLVLPLQLLSTVWLHCPSPKLVRSSFSSPTAHSPHYFWSDGMCWTQGSSFCLHSSETKGEANDRTCRLPTTCESRQGAHEVQTSMGSP